MGRSPRNRLYEIWRGVIRRCETPNCKDYKHYHGRHITVCQEWHDYETFRKWAISNGYRDDLTLDRVNNNLGYRPNNCRWISRKAQAQNRVTCIRVNINGVTKNLSEWARTYGISKDLVTRRMKRGWDPVRAITTPVQQAQKTKVKPPEQSGSTGPESD